MRYRKVSSWQEEENIWDSVSSRCPGEMEASCDGGGKGETKETEQGVLKVMVSNSVYCFVKKCHTTKIEVQEEYIFTLKCVFFHECITVSSY